MEDKLQREYYQDIGYKPFLFYVTRFEVEDGFCQKYEPHVVGAEYHKELWVPAEELEEFNQHIIGKIEIISEYDSELS